MRIAIAFCAVSIAAMSGWGLAQAASARAASRDGPVSKDKTIALDTDAHLVGWWKFDETSGKSAADSSKQHHDGVLEGGFSFDTQSASGRNCVFVLTAAYPVG
jgi:hypothetical protein